MDEPPSQNEQSLAALMSQKLGGGRYQFHYESEEISTERTSRLKRAEAKDIHEQLVEKMVTGVALGVLAVIVVGSLLFIAFSADPDKVKGSFAVLGTASSGCVGYALGRSRVAKP